MTKLGSPEPQGIRRELYVSARQLKGAQAGAIVRNNCDTGDRLSEGQFFMKADSGDRWNRFNPFTGSSYPDPLHGSFSAEQIHLPVEAVEHFRVVEFRDELRFIEETVIPARKAFEAALEGSPVYVQELDEDDPDYDDYADVDGYREYSEDDVNQAWLAAVRTILGEPEDHQANLEKAGKHVLGIL